MIYRITVSKIKEKAPIYKIHIKGKTHLKTYYTKRDQAFLFCLLSYKIFFKSLKYAMARAEFRSNVRVPGIMN